MTIKNIFTSSLILPFIVFIVLLPVSIGINFYQNDDWVYYLTVENFLHGNFTLHSYSGPTIFLQALLGMMFSKIFGIAHLPVLTLFMACLSLYFFILILREFLNIPLRWSFVLGLLFFANPLGVYELWGFMTGHYFEVFLLSAFYYFLKYEKTHENRYYLMYIVLVFLGLLIRQVSLVMPIAVGLYYLLRKESKRGIFNLGYFALLYFYYNNVFPMTARMIEVPLQFQHFLKSDYAYAIVYGSLLVLTAYSLPLVINVIKPANLFFPKLMVIAFFAIGSLAYIVLNSYFKPMAVSWGEFPYFENVVERTGFYPRAIHGSKYYFAGNYDLWRYWDIAAKVLFAGFISYWVLCVKKTTNIFLLYLLAYMGLMVITETYYDRYIFTVFPIILFYLLSLDSNIVTYIKLFLLGFVAFSIYLAYLFSADFILVNKYVWNKSTELVRSNQVEPQSIQATNAWKMTYRNLAKDYRYNFSYDSQKTNSDYQNYYELVDEFTVDFPLNIFVNPKIYLYKRIMQ